MEHVRLQKYLAEAGIASRRKCEEFICEGRVQVNGETALLGCVVNPEQDHICFDGKPVSSIQQKWILLFYKPRGVVSTSRDPQGRKTVQSFFQEFPARLYSVGRLDINSEGLLVMTNDGELAARLTHPRYEVEKTYYAVCDGELTAEQAEALRNGVMLEDGMTAPARLGHIARTKTGQTSLQISIHEGRNRQVRRMLEAVGHKTLLLKRERIGRLALGTLRPGEWRHATPAEREWLESLKEK